MMRRLRPILLVASVGVVDLLAATPAHAGAERGDPSKVGDLVGNLPVAVYLLIPLAVLLALLTAIVLGSRGAPDAAATRTGGVSRALSRRDAGNPPPP